jgi:hypothetical protein
MISLALTQWIVVFIQALALVALSTLSGSVFAANKILIPEIIRYRPSFPVTGMVVLSNDSLLLWHGDGRAQLRDSNHGWSNPFLLPVNRDDKTSGTGCLGILKIIADKEGMLVLQEPTGLEKNFSVLLISLDNKVLEKWIIQQYPLDLKSDVNGRRVFTEDGVIELLPNAALSSPTVFPAQYSDAVK